MSLTPRRDLRGGEDCWRDDPRALPHTDDLPDEVVDLAIVGAGITGAILADRFTAAGRRVVVLDRRPPATGSTAASTALVLWAADVPLVEHRDRYGAEGAQARWRAVFAAVQALDHRVRALGLDAGWRARPDLYLAGDRLDPAGLRREGQARKAAGLPSLWLDGPAVARRFGVRAEAALVSDSAFEVDPVALTRGLLAAAASGGAKLVFPVEVQALAETDDHVRLDLDDGRRLTARHAILATGYEVGGDLPQGFTLGSSFAIATAPGQAAAWGELAMIWEASDPYVYLRTTPDGRIVVGGADEDFADPERRDALIPEKAPTLAKAAARRLGRATFDIDCAWAATFGSTDDGLPGIGRWGDARRTFVARSFGGNGVAFAGLASQILPDLVAGRASAAATLFRPDRFVSP